MHLMIVTLDLTMCKNICPSIGNKKLMHSEPNWNSSVT